MAEDTSEIGLFAINREDVNSEDRWVEHVFEYHLWFQFLAISPSYELARRHQAGELSTEERASAPKDFDLVLSVFGNLGDVQRVTFADWWKVGGRKHFGWQGMPPKVSALGMLTASNASPSEAVGAFEKYVGHDWAQQGFRDTVLLAVPAGITVEKALAAIRKLLKESRVSEDEAQLPKPTYALASKRYAMMTLLNYLMLVKYRAFNLGSPLWRIGAQANLSRTHSAMIDPVLSAPTAANADSREMLSVMTSRALRRAMLISENAARGNFPSHKNSCDAREFNFSDLRSKVTERHKWSENQIIEQLGTLKGKSFATNIENALKLSPRTKREDPAP